MICSSCRRTLLSRISTTSSKSSQVVTGSTINTSSVLSSSSKTTCLPSRLSIRSITTTASPRDAATTTISPPGLSQPFAEPFFPSSTTTNTTSASTSPNSTINVSKPTKLKSSIPGGTPLQALVYVKQPPKPLVALEDHEYPDWLWGLLSADGNVASASAPGGSSAADGGLDLASMTKKSRARYERKQAKLLAGLEKPVPLHEQSRDLTRAEDGDGVKESLERRAELTRSMRGARRKGIREANFLRSM